MRLEAISYDCGGVTLTGHLALPPTGRLAPGVLVAHDASGVNEHVNGRAAALAGLGYAAFALDLYGVRGFPRDEMTRRHVELFETPGLVLRRAMAALRTFAAQPLVDASRIAAIGFCQGGSTVLELARADAPILAAIGFHPGYVRPKGSPEGRIAAKVLMMSGTDDPYASKEDTDAFITEMKAKASDWQLHLFGGVGHTFTDPGIDALGLPGMAYDATADRLSWAMMASLLEICFEHPAESR